MTAGEKPIDPINATWLILIVDEPQSVDGGLKGWGMAAIDAMNSLSMLRDSVTHVDKHHMVNRLDAINASERKLAKQIEVASATSEDALKRTYGLLTSTSKKRGVTGTRVKLDVEAVSKPSNGADTGRARSTAAVISNRRQHVRSIATAALASYESSSETRPLSFVWRRGALSTSGRSLVRGGPSFRSARGRLDPGRRAIDACDGYGGRLARISGHANGG